MEYLYIIASILILPGILYGIYTQLNVSRTFNAFKNMQSSSGKTAAEVARLMLDAEGLTDVQIKQIKGNLTDNYDPKKKVLNLSQTTYNSTSVSALGVCAHEVGHAIQHKEGYKPLIIRNKLVPIVNFASGFFWILFIIGMILTIIPVVFSNVGVIFIWISVAMYASTTIFYLVTLPVEYNASKRAIANLERLSILNSEELPLADKVLQAAAKTYVASLVMSILYFFKFLMQVIVLINDNK